MKPPVPETPPLGTSPQSPGMLSIRTAGSRLIGQRQARWASLPGAARDVSTMAMRHIVLFKWKEGGASKLEEIKAGLAGLPALIPQVRVMASHDGWPTHHGDGPCGPCTLNETFPGLGCAVLELPRVPM